MKYILKKDLPLAKAGTEVKHEMKWIENGNCITNIKGDILAWINEKDIPEWLEEVKEPKTIYDLKEGDEYWTLELDNEVDSFTIENVNPFIESDNTWVFPTEREAKRNKLLRELATREKWLPEKGEIITDILGRQIDWRNNQADSIAYNLGLVFRNEEEYNKWITEEAKDLLFKI